ncbi:MAG: hypothetical protein RL497_1917 [Pseudomonadota bacterium]|jgi:uncharacterized protein (TIGR02594 family)
MTNTLKNGSAGDDVKRLQEQLNSVLKLNPPLATDGKFGLNTERVVQTFQAQNKLGVDGIAGPKTHAALNAKLSGKPVQPPPPALTTPGSSGAAWFEIAKKEIGVKEQTGSAANPRILDYFKATTLKTTSDETPWCAAFVNWCLAQAGITGTLSAAAASWVNWGSSKGAQTGAITVIHNPAMANSSLSRSGNHVGFLVEETSTHYVLIGGNQGNEVKETRFPKKSWKLKGHRWPN